MGAYLSLSIPVLILAAAVQSSFAPQIRVLGGSPDFVFLVVLSWSVGSEFPESLTWAFVGGIIQDLLSAAPLGASALGLINVVFIVHLLNRGMYNIGFLLLAVLVIAGSVLKEMLFALVMAIVGFPNDFQILLSYVVFPTAVYNLAVFAPVYVVIRQIHRRTRPQSRVFRL
jgi:rod shape-determining protein MreD